MSDSLSSNEEEDSSVHKTEEPKPEESSEGKAEKEPRSEPAGSEPAAEKTAALQQEPETEFTNSKEEAVDGTLPEETEATEEAQATEQAAEEKEPKNENNTKIIVALIAAILLFAVIGVGIYSAKDAPPVEKKQVVPVVALPKVEPVKEVLNVEIAPVKEELKPAPVLKKAKPVRKAVRKKKRKTKPKKVALNRGPKKLMGGMPVVVGRVKNSAKGPRSVLSGIKKGLYRKIGSKLALEKSVGNKRGYYVDTSLSKFKKTTAGKRYTLEVSCALTISQAPGKALRLSARAETAGALENGNDDDKKDLESELALACGKSLAEDVLDFAKKRKK